MRSFESPLGCTVSLHRTVTVVRPEAPFSLVLMMRQPGDGRIAEVLLNEDNLRDLRDQIDVLLEGE